MMIFRFILCHVEVTISLPSSWEHWEHPTGALPPFLLPRIAMSCSFSYFPVIEDLPSKPLFFIANIARKKIKKKQYEDLKSVK